MMEFLEQVDFYLCRVALLAVRRGWVPPIFEPFTAVRVIGVSERMRWTAR